MLKPIMETVKAVGRPRFTTEFPEQRESLPDSYRAMFKLDIETCISCSACAIICPNKTIDMVETPTDRGIKKMPQIGIERCLFCALCAEVCPPKCLTLSKNYDALEAYDKRDFVKGPEDLE